MNQDPYSESFWNEQCPTYEKWAYFMGHSYDDPSRQMAYDIIGKYLGEHRVLAEIGFGDCRDFDSYFKQLHDDGRIRYIGYDIIPRFVEFAQQKFPGYTFAEMGFMNLTALSYDITYTRHTLEHIAPTLWGDCLRALLQATRLVAVQTWFLCPSDESIRYDGAWLNAYEREDVEEIIVQEDFHYRRHEVEDSDDCIYVMERRE